MKKNMGIIDKAIRLIAAIVIAILYYTTIVTGTIGLALVLLGAIFVLTSLISFCPLYLPFGISTCKTKD